MSLSIPVSEQIFRKNDWGKPYLVSRAVEFSLTHAAYYAACALDASPVGLDLEVPRVTMPVARRCFHPDEVSFLETLSEPEQPDALLRLWTIKEAYTKQLGSGLLSRSILSMQTCMKARQTCIRTAAPFPSACTNIH